MSNHSELQRPKLSKDLAAGEFIRYYYLKEELIAFCRENKLAIWGGKQQLTTRIEYFLTTGTHLSEQRQSKKKKIGYLSINNDTVIEKDITFSQVHRAFFKQEIGPSFAFNIDFQMWLKKNHGKSYREAVDAYYELKRQKRATSSSIGKQYEYNTYIRDFFKQTKGYTLKDAIFCWQYKKSIRGHNRFERIDLDVLKVKK